MRQERRCCGVGYRALWADRAVAATAASLERAHYTFTEAVKA